MGCRFRQLLYVEPNVVDVGHFGWEGGIAGRRSRREKLCLIEWVGGIGG